MSTVPALIKRVVVVFNFVRVVPVLRQRAVDEVVLVALASHVPAEAQEGGDVDAVDVLRVAHVAAQVKLCQETLRRLLLVGEGWVEEGGERSGTTPVPLKCSPPINPHFNSAQHFSHSCCNTGNFLD